ncbi:MAG: HAD family phosphatase [Candidatus Phytoplasma sp.]|nr:HAD family phosphatase [Phytoplasma sp.]
MKKIIFFDVDNTILSNKQKRMLPQTKKLLEELNQDPNTILGFATGRGPSKVSILKETLPFFDYQILVNGAVTLNKQGQIISEIYIQKKDLEEALAVAKEHQINIGMVGFDQEVITGIDQTVEKALSGFQNIMPEINPKYYLNNHIYQIWMFQGKENDISNIVSKLSQFIPYFWHQDGVDLVYPSVNKANAIYEIKKKYPEHTLICIGDGHNDIDMIKMADIGVAMANTGYEELIEAADLIAPHIEEDRLYDFFKENNLLNHKKTNF